MKGLFYLGGVAVSIVFGYLTFQGFDWERSSAALTALSIADVAAAVAAVVVGYAVRITRWRFMLAIFRPDLRFTEAMAPLLGGMALNCVLPLRAGDFARIFAFQATLRVKPFRVVSTMLLERVLDVLVLLMFLGVGLLLIDPHALPEAALDFGGVAILGVAAAMFALVFMPRQGAWCMRRLARSSLARLPGARVLLTFGARTLFSIAALCSAPILTRLILLSVVAWTLEGCGYFAIAVGLSHDTAAFAPWFAMATGTLGTLLPSTPGHVGTFDYFAKIGFMAFGGDAGMAALQALAIHVLLWVPITILGGLSIALSWGGHAWANLRNLAKLRSGKPMTISN